ncbi:MAG: TIGR03905 family TSCPD domain-containing protein [Bacilli bacterium]|nr:TIGR03905 family TSCPD domain-containing protein [Bacilli bacterium]
MEETFRYIPKNVCSRELVIHYDGDTVLDMEVVGGCNGNLQGITALMKGMKIDDVIAKLNGIKCRGSRTRMTSCPDQISLALIALKEQKANEAAV